MDEWDPWEGERRIRRIMKRVDAVDPENVTAEFKNGVLTVKMKKKS